MEPITIITTAMALLSPYFVKSGEKFAEGIGESLWTWIKTFFSKQGNESQLPNLDDKHFHENLKQLFQDKINSDENFKNEFEFEIEKMQEKINARNQQNRENIGNIEKQIIIQENHGNIQM